MVADHLPDAADVRQQPEPLAHLLPAPADRIELGVVVGQVEEDLLDLLVDRRGEQRERLDGGLLGRERRVVRIGGQHGVELAGHLAEPAQPRQDAPAPSLIVSRASSQPSTPPVTKRCRMPSVASIGPPV